jgi:hypothetical protein
MASQNPRPVNKNIIINNYSFFSSNNLDFAVEIAICDFKFQRFIPIHKSKLGHYRAGNYFDTLVRGSYKARR